MQHQGARSRRHNGIVIAKATLGLIIIDVLEDPLVPTVSDPVDVVPPWNQSAESLLEAVFVFVEDYLQDDGAIIVIHPFQVDAESTILGYCIEYGFETRKKWLCMNRFHLCSPLNRTLTISSLPKSSFSIDASLNCVVFELSSKCLIFIYLYGVVQTQHFGAYLLVKKGSSKFTFSTSSSMKDIGVDVAFDEWLQNFTTRTDQAMNGQKPWHGPQEKSPGFWQVLIEASTLPGDIVLDCIAMTGEASSTHCDFLMWFYCLCSS
jgi:hypothetical protein